MIKKGPCVQRENDPEWSTLRRSLINLLDIKYIEATFWVSMQKGQVTFYKGNNIIKQENSGRTILRNSIKRKCEPTILIYRQAVFYVSILWKTVWYRQKLSKYSIYKLFLRKFWDIIKGVIRGRCIPLHTCDA